MLLRAKLGAIPSPDVTVALGGTLLQREKRSIWRVISNPVILVSEVFAGLLFLFSLGFG